jgi:hypothetical protein
LSWKKHFKVVEINNVSPLSSSAQSQDFSFRNYQYQLPEIYVGHPNRVERYNQYEQMDMDSEVNAALDVLSEFCTQVNIENQTPFDLVFKEVPTDRELKILKEQLQQWVALNQLDKRAFKLVRNTLKYGDQVFLRDPETFELFWVEMSKVTKVIVNESKGKEPEQYVLKEINPNFKNLTATQVTTSDTFMNHPQTGGANGSYVQPNTPYAGGGRFTHAQNEMAISAEHIVHLSLTEGLDVNWPFGNSILEQIFKVFKQKELLEDAILIYRIQRAPERRIFKIDTGNMPSHLAMAFVERVKNEVHQRRIPTQTGGGTNMMDATYNPLSINEDYFFPFNGETGRGSSVDTLQGGQNLGEIDDLRYFTNKLFRGLRIPSSYLPTGPEDGSQSVTDGKVGTALIQEWRFNQYCKRLQNMIVDKLNDEFKMFIRWRGINIDAGVFDLRFNDPQNFASYKQAEVDQARVTTFTSLEQYPYLSKRFLLKRYLGLTEEEMAENDSMWAEEKGDTEEMAAGDVGLRSVGITPGGIQSDMGDVEALAPIPTGEGEAAPEGGSPVGGGVPTAPQPGAASTTQAPPGL